MGTKNRNDILRQAQDDHGELVEPSVERLSKHEF